MIDDQQMRSLTVCKIGLDSHSSRKEKLKSIFTSSKNNPSSNRDDHLLILTCDKLAIVRDDDDADFSTHGGGSSSFSAADAVVMSLPLTLIHSTTVEQSSLVIQYYSPAAAHASTSTTKSSSSLPKGPSPRTSPSSLLQSDSTPSAIADTSCDDVSTHRGSFSFTSSFPLFTAIEAFSKLGKSDGGVDSRRTLKLHTDSVNAAHELAASVHSALRRLHGALLWLDRGLPLDIHSSLAVSTVSIELINNSHQQLIISGGCLIQEVVLQRAPSWGSTIKFPTEVQSSTHAVLLHIDLSTPLGPCHATVPVAQLVAAPAGGRVTVQCANLRSMPPMNLSVSITLGVATKKIENNSNLLMITSTSGGGGGLSQALKLNGEEQKKDAAAVDEEVQQTSSLAVMAALGAVVAMLVSFVVSHFSNGDLGAAVVALVAAVAASTTTAVLFYYNNNNNTTTMVATKESIGTSTGNMILSSSSSSSSSAGGGSLALVSIVDSVTLLHAELVEGPPPSPSASSATTTAIATTTTSTNKDGEGEAPVNTSLAVTGSLTRKLTTALTLRQNYLDGSTAEEEYAFASSSSLSSTAAAAAVPSNKNKPSRSLIDLGAISMRRVVTSTASASTSVPASRVMSSMSEEEPAEGGVSTIKLSHTTTTMMTTTTTATTTTNQPTPEESARLKELHTISPAITPALFHRYVTACQGNRGKALDRLQATAEWRSSHGIDTILTAPAPLYTAIKAAYLHCVIGWTRDGAMPVVVEGMGGFKAALAQMRQQSITPAEMIQQFIFVLEYILEELTVDTGGSFVRIYDLKGIGLMDLADKEAISLGQQMMDLLEKYYPERMALAFVVNAPSFFSTIWRMVKPLLDPRTAKKISVVSGTKAALAALRTVMDDEVIPKAYGGLNLCGVGYGATLPGASGGFENWYRGEEEVKLAAIAAKLNSCAEL